MTEPTDREAFLRAVETAKLEAMKELAYGASHEINNPLANIAARAQTLLKRIDDPADRRMLEAIHRQAMRAHEMISDLMLFARPPALERRTVAVAPIVREAVESLVPLADERSIRLRVDTASPDAASPDAPSSDAAAFIDPLQLSVALTALVENSIEAIGESGEVGVSVRSVSTGGGTVEIEVRDSGPGIADDIRAKVFDPFFSGREAGRGLGFGLSKCWRIVTDHGGAIDVESPHGGGAVFTIRLPATAE
ncbi:MAG: HAMP domain-containing sensor histidine kinase [Planctomycetota bacterium]